MSTVTVLALSILFGLFAAQPQEADPMLPIPGGAFVMGNTYGDEDERQARSIALTPFYLSKYELTNREFVDFLNDTDVRVRGEEVFLNGQLICDLTCTSCGNWQDRIRYTWRRFRITPGFAEHPVVMVTWYGTLAYCNWRSEQEGLPPVYQLAGDTIGVDWSATGYRLPTEAEWEFAAAGGSAGEAFAGTHKESQLAAYANFCDQLCAFEWRDSTQQDQYGRTAPVGSYQPSRYGLFDLSGNVWEWCWDWYQPQYEGTGEIIDPRGPDSGTHRVIRGGSWNCEASDLRSTNRANVTPESRSFSMGFRLARAD